MYIEILATGIVCVTLGSVYERCGLVRMQQLQIAIDLLRVVQVEAPEAPKVRAATGREAFPRHFPSYQRKARSPCRSGCCDGVVCLGMAQRGGYGTLACPFGGQGQRGVVD